MKGKQSRSRIVDPRHSRHKGVGDTPSRWGCGAVCRCLLASSAGMWGHGSIILCPGLTPFNVQPQAPAPGPVIDYRLIVLPSRPSCLCGESAPDRRQGKCSTTKTPRPQSRNGRVIQRWKSIRAGAFGWALNDLLASVLTSKLWNTITDNPSRETDLTAHPAPGRSRRRRRRLWGDRGFRRSGRYGRPGRRAIG